MLTIRKEQMRHLGAAADDAHLRQAAEMVAAHWPNRAEQMGRDALVDRLRAVQRVSEDCGLRERADLLRLANVAMALDDELTDESRLPWAHDILNNERLRPADRLDVLDARVRAWLQDRSTPT